jgi:tripartite-type tricarboxylate transporter receptor subunit TctC
MSKWPRLGAGIIVAILPAFAASGASAEPAAEFYSGKTITVIVGSAAGGGFDLYARTLSVHMPRHAPGHPKMQLQFMPGAGGTKATNYLYTVSPRDGSVFALPSQGVALAQKLTSGVRYDAAKMNWIGRMVSTSAVLVVWHTAPATKLEQMKNSEIVFGTTGKGRDTYFFPRMMETLLGYKVKVVAGYPGAAHIMNAMERGELHGYTSNWAALLGTRGDWLREGKLIPIASASMEKRKDYPQLPLLAELTTDPHKRAIIEFFSSAAGVGRSFALPPDVPRERVGALRRAFDQTMVDSAFAADAKKRKMELEPLKGEQVQAVVERVIDTPESVIEAAKKAVE